VSLIIKPEISEAAEKAKRNALQQERRRLALVVLPYVTRDGKDISEDVSIALGYADRLIDLTRLED
jgi:hypothetical protein